MVRALLVRGMLAGVVAGLLAFGFARVFGEPPIEWAIAFEAQAGHAGQGHGHAAAEAEPELVSRNVQAGIGLLSAVVLFGAGIGGLFALTFAFVYGRIGRIGPRATAALLAAGGFVSIALVPVLKYPANPPALGQPETLASRTALFLIMIAISIAALTLAAGLACRLVARFGSWKAAIVGAVAFVAIVAAAQVVLPDFNEVPQQFSADMLWRFRAASLGMQMLMWATLGLVFGALTARIIPEQ